MKLNHITNIEGFFKAVDECNGPVMLIGDGIQLDLKSKLAQYFSLAEIFSGGEIPELEIMVNNPDDANRMIKFMIG